MKCPRCQHENRGGQKFCGDCGTPLQRPSGTAYASYSDVQRSLTEALERQTATAEILRVISSSPTELQSVLDAVAESATRLCAAYDAVIFRRDGDVLRIVAHHGPISSTTRTIPIRGTVSGRAVLGRQPIHVADLQAETGEFPEGVTLAREYGFHTLLSVPLLREGVAIGTINLRRTEVRPFTDSQIALLQTFADQAVIAIENVRLFAETKEALEQQIATAEILRVISSSPTELKPVFDTIARNAVRVCDSTDALVALVDGDETVTMAHYGDQVFFGSNRRPITRGLVVGRAVLDARPIQVADLTAAGDFPDGRELALRMGHRTVMAVPLLRDGVAIGAILMRRSEVKPFTDKQIALLQTFADQAVIAIENVRLFTETKQALERQTATGEILRVISSSPTDVQPVFDAVVRHGARLCEAANASLHVRESAVMRKVAEFGHVSTRLTVGETRPITRTTVSGRAIIDRRTINIGDLHTAEIGHEYPESRHIPETRACLGIPLLREAGEAVGALFIFRTEDRPFSDNEIELLQTFADQAVIAIENVRLFKELEARNTELMDALEKQTATSEILRVISRSQTDVQPVFDTIIRSAVRLLDGFSGLVTQIVGDQLHLVALTSTNPSGDAAQKALWPRPVNDYTSLHAQVITALVPLFISDSESDRSVPPSEVAVARARGYRSVVAVPLLRDGRAIGSISVTRRAPGPFADGQIAVLQTFADQAVIAIENVRLFNELQARNRDLTEALDRQTATAEVLRVISQSQTDVQPVFDAIVDNALRLFRAWSASVFRVEDQLVHLIAARGGLPGSEHYLRERSPWPLHEATTVARCIADRSVAQIPDADSDSTVDAALRDRARARGWRSSLSAPMLRDGQPIGVISITRAEAGPFSPAEIELLQTFADQAVIAIENARLLGELRERTAELTRSVGELRALGAVGQALSSTLDVDVVLDTIVTRANDLIGADGCTIFEYDEGTEQFHLRATRNLEPRLVELARGTPLRKGDQGILGQLPMGRQAVQVPDITTGSYSSPISDALIEAGYRAIVAVPLIREDHLIGALTMNRKTPGEFSHETIELLQTFATQSALAIQNARLFREIEDKSHQLEVASQHKSEFLANMSHELRTPLNAIIGFSEVLGERMFGDLNEKQEEYLKDIHASGQHLLSLINDILDLSKIEAGRMELELSDFDLPMTIDNALMLIRERAARRSIALNTAVDERVGQVQADERKIRQVILNLLSNAIKFTPEGGRIEVGAKPVDGSIEVSVSDTGVGIAPEDQEAVFEEFRQVGTADKKVEGTGLGLALSRKFIELHGGRIWVESQVGEGSTFTFTLPVRRGE